MKWEVFAHKLQIRFIILILVASVALPTTFNFVGEFTVLYSLSLINVWYAVLGGTDYFGAYYMLKMYQHVMLGETNERVFADVSFKEGLALVVLLLSYSFFWDVSKTNQT
jgi:NADH-quinone oxidoreductase subunit M